MLLRYTWQNHLRVPLMIVGVWGTPGKLNEWSVHGTVDKVVSITKWDGEVDWTYMVFVVNPAVGLYTWHWSWGGDDEGYFQ
jgi:hypothetical protein